MKVADDQWFRFDDTTASSIDKSQIGNDGSKAAAPKKEHFASRTAYALVYEKDDEKGTQFVQHHIRHIIMAI